jgi:hypothetical protein
MRVLSVHEVEHVSGGSNSGGPNDFITVTAGTGVQLNWTSGISLGIGFGGIGGYQTGAGASFPAFDFSSLFDDAAKAVADWLKDLTPEADEEIVVTGTIPPKIEIGPGTEVRTYKDGINQLYIDGELVGNVRFTDGSVTVNRESNPIASPIPSWGWRESHGSTLNYHFTSEQ